MTSIESSNIPTNLDNNKQSPMSPEADIVQSQKPIKMSQQPVVELVTQDEDTCNNQTDFKAEASPFFPPSSSTTMHSQDDQTTPDGQTSEMESKIQEVTSTNSKLQWELDKVITIAKQQHQYINNLQKANMNLKAEAKSLKDQKNDREKLAERNQNSEFNVTTNSGSAAAEQPIQSFDLVSIGKIEQISKAEKSAQRNSSSSRHYDQRDQFSVDQKENCHFDINMMQDHDQSMRDDKQFGGFDNDRTFADGGDRQQNFSSNRGGRGGRGDRGRGGQNRQRGGGNRGHFDGLAHQHNRGDNFQVDRDRQRNGGDFNQNRNNGDRNNNGRGRARNNNGQNDRNQGNRNHQRRGTNYNDVDNFMPSDRHPDNSTFNHSGAPDRHNNRNGQNNRGGQGRGRARNGRDNNRRGGHDNNNSGEPFFSQPFQVSDTDPNTNNSDPFDCSDNFQPPRQERNQGNQKSSRGGRGRGQARNNDMRRARQEFTHDSNKQEHSDPFSCVDVANDATNRPEESDKKDDIFESQNTFDGQPAKLMSDINKRSEALEENKEKFFDQDDSQLYVIKNSNDFSDRHCFFEDVDQENVEVMGEGHQQMFDQNDGEKQADDNDYGDAFDVQKQEQVQTHDCFDDRQQEQQEQEQTQNNFFEDADPVIIWNNRGDQSDHSATVEEVKDPDQEQVNQTDEQPNDDRVESTEERQKRELLEDFNDQPRSSQEEELEQSQENFDWLYNEIHKATQSSDELKLQALLDKAYSFGDDFPYDLSEAECHLASLIDLTDKNDLVEDLD